MYRIAVLLGLVLCCLTPAPAQAPAPDDQQETIKALLKEVSELKARVAALEARQQPAEQPSGAAAAKPAEAPPVQPQVAGAETAPLGPDRGIKFQGFGAVTYRASDVKPPESAFIGLKSGSQGNFAIGDFDLFLTSHMTSKTMVLAELTFSERDDQEFEIDVERALLKYDLNDYLKMSFGRFHTATSYYNSVYHHGNWLQTAVDRPLVVEFADHGGLLPSQAVGTVVTGRVPSGGLGLNYVFEYATGDTIRPLINSPEGAEIDEENGNHLSGGLFFKPDQFPGLEIGGSFYHDRLNPEGSGIHIAQAIGSAHAVYVTPRFEFLSEGFLIQHKVQETGKTFNTPAFYALLSQKMGTRWRPYFRYQYANASPVSPLFSDVSLRHGPTWGVRYELGDYVAFKTQYDRIYRRGLPTINQVLSQLAFHF